MYTSRRELGRFIAGAGVALAAGPKSACLGVGEQAPMRFPEGFFWGVATASYQTEGAAAEDDRGPSIWDTYSHTPGKTINGDTGDVATDSYHRFREDIALMAAIGVKASRFSVAWPRIFPNGTGRPNPKGVDFYRRYVDTLRDAGIEPFCTLYHWDLPQRLQDKGGWQSKDTAQAFADYCGYMSGQFGVTVKFYITMNEMRSFIDLGYGVGRQAPGLKLPTKELAQARHWAVYGHGLGLAAIRASSAHVMVGTAENAYICIPAIDTPEHIAAARKATSEENASYLTVMHSGRYTEGYLQKLGRDGPVFTQEELAVISAPTDFQGLNIYTGIYVSADNGPLGYRILPLPKSYPHMASSFINIAPTAMYWGPKLISEELGIDAIYVTENGCSAEDVLVSNGKVDDTDRVMFLQSYLRELARAVSDRIPVKGYFVWSLLDNYEWSDGYTKRFGIVYVHFPTQRRIPKLSADFYRNVIERRAL